MDGRLFMRRVIRLAVFVLAAVLLLVPVASEASIITQYTDAPSYDEFYPGQSFTTPAGGPWGNIDFAWLRDTGVSSGAYGNLYLFASEYTGTRHQSLTSPRAWFEAAMRVHTESALPEAWA
jgi:hypothetical protein